MNWVVVEYALVRISRNAYQRIGQDHMGSRLSYYAKYFLPRLFS